jgi:AcrR family transcriptional regulator
MPPSPDPKRRQALLDRITDYVLQNGLGDLSLRPLARELGTSGRMLLYYFGAKDALVVDVLAEVRRRKYRDLGLASEEGGNAGVLRRYWEWVLSREGRTYLRLVYEIYGLSLRDPERFDAFLATEALEVLEVIARSYGAAGVPAPKARTLATYTFAALRGLELDLLATDDLPRLEQAFSMLEQDLGRRVDLLAETTTRQRRKP